MACWLCVFALITIPNPIIVANIDEPPYDIIGNGEPTIGSKPNTMLIFITIYIKIDVPKL